MSEEIVQTHFCAGTFEKRAALPDGDWASGSVLPQAQLHEEEGHAREEKHDEVRNEKHTCSSTKNYPYYLHYDLHKGTTIVDLENLL